MRLGLGFGIDTRGFDNGYVPFNFNVSLQSLPGSLSRLSATYTRNSLKNVLQNGVLVELAANQFGTSYDPVTRLYGYLPETAATNLFLYSQDYTTGATWTKSSSSIISSNNIAPDGTSTAALFQCSGASGYLQQGKTLTAASYSAGIYVKKGNTRYVYMGLTQGSACDYIFDLDNDCAVTNTGGSPTGYLVTKIGTTGWYGIAMSRTAAASASNFAIYPTTSPTSIVSSNGSNIYVWGAQLETGTYASSYIKTTSGTATRSADVLTMPLANLAGFSSSAYTLVNSHREIVLFSSGFFDSVQLNSSNRAGNLRTASTAVNIVVNGGATQANQGIANTSVSLCKIGSSFSANNFLFSQNGSAAVADTSGSMPTGVTTYEIGSQLGATQANCYIFSTTLYTRALTQEQLNALTS